MTDTIRGASSNPTSQLSPPTLHWGKTGPDPTTCDLCATPIKPNGDCFISVRRAFELHHGRMIESAPLTVLMCVDCGWSRPYSPVPRSKPTDTTEGQKPPHEANERTDGPSYHDSGVMDDA